MEAGEQPKALRCQRCGGRFESIRETARYCHQCRVEASRRSEG